MSFSRVRALYFSSVVGILAVPACSAIIGLGDEPREGALSSVADGGPPEAAIGADAKAVEDGETVKSTTHLDTSFGDGGIVVLAAPATAFAVLGTDMIWAGPDGAGVAKVRKVDTSGAQMKELSLVTTMSAVSQLPTTMTAAKDPASSSPVFLVAGTEKVSGASYYFLSAVDSALSSGDTVERSAVGFESGAKPRSARFGAQSSVVVGIETAGAALLTSTLADSTAMPSSIDGGIGAAIALLDPIDKTALVFASATQSGSQVVARRYKLTGSDPGVAVDSTWNSGSETLVTTTGGILDVTAELVDLHVVVVTATTANQLFFYGLAPDGTLGFSFHLDVPERVSNAVLVSAGPKKLLLAGCMGSPPRPWLARVQVTTSGVTFDPTFGMGGQYAPPDPAGRCIRGGGIDAAGRVVFLAATPDGSAAQLVRIIP